MSTRYVIVIPDGAADEPCDALGGRTPLQAAHLPGMDRIAREGILGQSRNVPDRFNPASDVATLSLFGYDPVTCYTGRAPLEAVAMGIELGPHDWAVRCNLITIHDGLMTDFTAGHITSEEGVELIEHLQRQLAPRYPGIEFHAGVSYRNALIYRGSAADVPFGDDTHTTPPHDVPDQPAADHLPRGKGSLLLAELMREGSALIARHPLNEARISAGKKPASNIWLWGQGRAPVVTPFAQQYGVRGAIIAAVDLVRGTGMLAGWRRIDVPGATGYLDTDYAAKGRAGVAALDQFDLVCVHVEAPDEASHEGRADAKVAALEQIDSQIVVPLLDALPRYTSWRILVSPDHATLLRTRAHDRAAVPWAYCGSGVDPCGRPYDEIAARSAGGPFLEEGYRLMERFLRLS